MAINNNDRRETSLEYFLSVLNNPESPAAVVYDVAQDVRTMQNEEMINPLIDRLTRGWDPFWVREELVTALGCVILLTGLDSPRARDLLLEILSSSENEEVREAAALTLGNLGDVRAVKILLEILESDEPGLMYACIAALGNLGDSRAIEPLIEYLKVDRLLIPQTAAQGLGKFGAAAKEALPALQELAERGNEAERRFASEAIAKIEQDLESKTDL